MTHFKALPPIERLQEIFIIDETSASGLRNKIKRNGIKVGDISGAATKGGYWKVMVDGVFYKVHRIIYALSHGVDPGFLIIDHINRNKQDNRINNLRLVSRQVNGINANIYSHNTTGVKGVSSVKKGATVKFRARITLNGACKHLGYFDTAEEAEKAREAAERELFDQSS
jgi:hypothetical protein